MLGNNRFARYRALWLIMVPGYLLEVAVGSLTPDYKTQPSSVASEIFHNSLHVPAYTALTFLILHLLSLWKVRALYPWAFILAWLFGVAMEVYQGYVPGRSPSVSDAALNTVGILLGILIFRTKLAKRFLAKI